MTAPRTLDDWLAHCERLHPKSMDFTLERVTVVRDRGCELRFECPVISVGGTNGKGSTCAMIESIARHAGYRTALYMSPHLVHFEERCLIDGRMADAATLLPHFEAVEAARGDITLTYFEFTTLAILRAFVHARPDVVILEVGLGGRLDAVNAFDADCAVVTGIALDHTEYLGPDRESIGREKAGIFRAGRPAIVGDPQPPASVIEHAARHRCRPAAAGPRLSLAGRSAAVVMARTLAPLQRAGATRRCAAPTSCSTPPPRWPRWSRCTIVCRSAHRRCATAWRWSSCPGDSRSCRVVPCWCSTGRTTRRRRARWR